MDPGTVVSSKREGYATRRAALVGRAATHRQELSRQLSPLTLGLERLGPIQAKLPAISIGAGLGLTALLLVLPGRRMKVLQSGLAMFHLAGSVRRLLARS